MAHVLYCINYIKIFFLTEYNEPTFIINLQVAYKSVASSCANAHHQDELLKNRENFTKEIFSICNTYTLYVGEVEITKIETTTSSSLVGLSYGYCDHESI